MNFEKFYEKFENMVLEGLDKAVEAALGEEKAGWHDDDLSLILPIIKKQAIRIWDRYNGIKE